MTKEAAAAEIAKLLQRGEYKLVLAESCTAGYIAMMLGEIPGISKNFCGSFVTYRTPSKRRWLGVKKKHIKAFTTESQPVADRMAKLALKQTPEADYALSIVGHLGPNAPKEKDGIIWVSVARRTRKGNIKVKEQVEYTCSANHDTPNGTALRTARRAEATEAALTALARHLNKVILGKPNDKANVTEKLKNHGKKKAKVEKPAKKKKTKQATD